MTVFINGIIDESICYMNPTTILQIQCCVTQKILYTKKENGI